MIGALTLLLCYQLVGEILARSLGLPLPGPVLGMMLLFVTLLVRGGVPSQLQHTSQRLLRYLSLLFVPAGVGVMVHIGLLSSEWFPVTILLVVSTVLTIAVTALTLHGLQRIARTFAQSQRGTGR